ncbi:MAG TPA: ATP-binding protein [Blastocatellia bacterium]|nr:ATP-binding protein [Blastocatellia bacterium]
MRTRQTIQVAHSSDVSEASRIARTMTLDLGCDETTCSEIALVASELAANLVKHTRGGWLTLSPIDSGGRIGIQIESVDHGPGIPDVERALTDGFSTAGGLGYGLGAVNRLMDDLDIQSRRADQPGTRIVCKRWLGGLATSLAPCPLEFGVAARPHPTMTVSGDAFVVKRWEESALVGVIDGLGHGEFAHRAGATARHYVETHFTQPLDAIFLGVARACRATRGVVMALGRFDWAQERMTFASIGNVEARVFGADEPMNFIVRRGVLGGSSPMPMVTHHRWKTSNVMVLHSDGLATRWRWEDIADLAGSSATAVAHRLLQKLARDDDDATVLVVKEAPR